MTTGVDVTTTVRLLGVPGIDRAGVPVASPRGKKVWALLGYVVCSTHPVSRQHLAELLFSEADDPMGALRWVLAELRRTLHAPDAFRGDPISPHVEGVEVDVVAVSAGDEAALLNAGGVFLDGVHVDGCAAFETWLGVERYRVSAELEARLRHAAEVRLATGDHQRAVQLAARAVGINVLDEVNHELLVRGLIALGDRPAAMRQIAVCEDVLRRELGHGPSAALRSAADQPAPAPANASWQRADAESQLDIGQAAVKAGATHTGIDALYRAVSLAQGAGDAHLHARAALALGSALVHAVRGRDGEGSTVLHLALHLAQGSGDRALAMTASRELGFVEVQAGRRRTATEWLERAAALAVTDAERAATLAIQGMNMADIGRHLAAVELFSESAALAASAGDLRQQAWSLGVMCRSSTVCGDHAAAKVAAEQSIDLCRAERWVAFLPWPRAFLAELHLSAGDAELAREEIEPAWALSCQLGDPCWEGVTARVLSALSAHAGDLGAAHTWLAEALRRCEAATDTYQWVRAYIIDAQIELALTVGDAAAATMSTGRLAELAARTEMHEFGVRSQLHRAALGEPGAAESARLLAIDIENPALHRRVRALEAQRP